MEEIVKNILKITNFGKIRYTLLSNGKGDCPQAEELVKNLDGCEITHMPFFSRDDLFGHNIGELLYTYPTLCVLASWNSNQYVGYEAIEKYVNKKLTKKYLLVWLALEFNVSLVIVSRLVELSF